jgi:hypothetical protein
VVDVTDRVGTVPAVDVTRYLAAAAYLDEDFRDDVIFQTLHQKHRFIAPSYGVNIGCVVRHCIGSRRLSRRRDLILSALIFFGVWALHLPLVVALAVFAGGVLVAIGLASPRLHKLRWKVLLSIVAYVAFLAFALHPLSLLSALAALFVVSADMYERRYRVVARHMNSRNFDADAPAYGRERPSQRAADEKRIAHLHGHQDGNVVVYSGFAPFIGSGVKLKRWSFAVNVDQSRSAHRIETRDVYAHVEEAMKNFELEGSTVVDRFFVSGKHVGLDPDLFFHPREQNDRFPRLRYTIDDIAALEEKPTELVRRYADIKVASWQSELVLSTFVRFTQTSRYLFVEVSYVVLPPLKSSYYAINSYRTHPTLHELLHLVARSATRTPLLWLTAPLRVAKWMARPITVARREQQVRHAIEENLRFDYGAIGSVRDSGSDHEYAKYFQKMDIERFQKIMDRHLLTTISEFLEEKGVDTRELEQRMQFIINQGLWVSSDFSPGIRNVPAGTPAFISH